MAQTEAQKKAQKKYLEKNREKTNIMRYRTSARTFVRHYATDEDIEELLKIYKEENKNSIKS